jgi:hypothetical protein
VWRLLQQLLQLLRLWAMKGVKALLLLLAREPALLLLLLLRL